MANRTVTLNLTVAQEAGVASEMARYLAGHPDPDNAIKTVDAYLSAWLLGKVNEWTRAVGDADVAAVMADPAKRDALVASAKTLRG